MLGAAVPALALDPEQLLWTPTKTIFDLGAGRDLTPIVLADQFSVDIDYSAQGNQFITAAAMAKELDAEMMRRLYMAALVDMAYRDELMVEGVRIGGQVSVRLKYRPDVKELTDRVTLVDAG
ncbi:MAG: hypothetical protein ACYC2H_01370 [Thermoplasmatota archaeon]